MESDEFLNRGEDANVDVLEKGLRNKWCWSWLDEKDGNGDFIASYVRKIRIPGKAVCMICEPKKGKRLDYKESGLRAFQKHSSTKSHRSKRLLLHENTSLPSSFQSVSDLESGATTVSKVLKVSESLLPYGTPQHVADEIAVSGDTTNTGPVTGRTAVSMVDRISHLEGLVCSFIAEHSLPLKAAQDIVDLAKELAGDPKALSELKLSRKSATVKLVHGVHAVHHKRLVAAMKAGPFSINLDESTVKSSKKRVLNVLVCQFSEDLQKTVTSIYCCLEMTVVNSETVYTAVVEQLEMDEIPLTNLISILSDSAAYMRGNTSGFQARMKDVADHLLDIDGDVCHHIHNIVKLFATKVDEEKHLARLLDDIYRDFSYSADLRADLLKLCSILGVPEHVPIERVEHRWLSLLDATIRFKELFKPLTIFYNSFLCLEDRKLYAESLSGVLKPLPKVDRTKVLAILTRLKSKGLTDLGKARKKRITKKLFDMRRKTTCLMNFFLEVLPSFKKFILTFEKAEPQVHLLHDEVQSVYRDFLSRFVRPEHLQIKSLEKINLTDSKIFKAAQKISIGQECLNDLPSVDRQSFTETVKAAFIDTAIYMSKKLPLGSRTLKLMSSIDPTAHGHEVSANAMKRLGRLLPTVLPPSLYTGYEREVDTFHCNPRPEFKEGTAIDVWWGTQFHKYPTIAKVLKACLSIFTGPRVEQSFSFLNAIIDPAANKLAVSTFEAYLATKYHLVAHDKTSVQLFHRADVLYDEVDKSLNHHIRNAWKSGLQIRKEKTSQKSTSLPSKKSTPLPPKKSTSLASSLPTQVQTKPTPQIQSNSNAQTLSNASPQISTSPIHTLPVHDESSPALLHQDEGTRKRKQAPLLMFFSKKPKHQ